MSGKTLTHFNEAGVAHMVDIGAKPITQRMAIAQGHILMHTDTLNLLVAGEHKKGDVLGVARIAAIMASKKTAELIPLCHPLALTHVGVEFVSDHTLPGVICTVTTKTNGSTGVEMEALTALQVALLTIYDMCKAVDRGMMMSEVRILQKTGGCSNFQDSDCVRSRHP